MAYNKVIYQNETIIDLTKDSVEPNVLLGGRTAHDRTGAAISGAMVNKSAAAPDISIISGKSVWSPGDDFALLEDSDGQLYLAAPPQEGYYDGSVAVVGLNADEVRQALTSDATAQVGDILLTKTAYVNGEKITGTMPLTASGRGEEVVLAGSGDNLYYSIHRIPVGYYYSNSGNNTWAPEATIEKAKFDTLIGVDASKIMAGQNIAFIAGTATRDGTASAANILINKTAYVNGQKLTGTMPNMNIVDPNVGGINSQYPNLAVHTATNHAKGNTTKNIPMYSLRPPAGWYDGQSYVGETYGNMAAYIELTAGKLAAGQTVLGVNGTYTNDANATTGSILNGATCYVKGSKIIGTMPNFTNNPDHIQYRRRKNNQYQVAVSRGYHHCDWQGTNTSYEYVTYSELASDIQLTANKISLGNTIIGVDGTSPVVFPYYNQISSSEYVMYYRYGSNITYLYQVSISIRITSEASNIIASKIPSKVVAVHYSSNSSNNMLKIDDITYILTDKSFTSNNKQYYYGYANGFGETMIPISDLDAPNNFKITIPVVNKGLHYTVFLIYL